MKELLNGLIHCLRTARGWLLAQLILTPVLLALAVAWLRIPDAEAWQFFIWVVFGVILLALLLGLEAGTLRALVGGARKAHFLLAMLWLLSVVLLAWIAYKTVIHYEDQIELAAGYLNSRLPAGRMRAAWLSRERIAALFNRMEWLLAWVGIPGFLIPIATLVSVDGVMLPKPARLNVFTKRRWWIPVLALCFFVIFAFWSKLPALILFAALGVLGLDWKSIRAVWGNWRWWPPVLVCAYAWTHWMLKAFNGQPHGSPREQELAVLWKTALAYLIGIACWLLPLLWAAVLVGRNRADEQPGGECGVASRAGSPTLNQTGAQAEV